MSTPQHYTNNAIFTKVRSAVLAVVDTANCTQTYTPTPTKWPTVFAREIGRLTPAQVVTFSNAQDYDERTWEVQIFSNLQTGAKEQAYKLRDAVVSAFKSMFFREYFESPEDSITGNNYYTLICRFRREIGSGETIPN